MPRMLVAFLLGCFVMELTQQAAPADNMIDIILGCTAYVTAVCILERNPKT